jgi:hypothetical protein
MRQYITRRVAILLATVALALSVPLAVFASHQFTDVPNSNLFHADIDALVDSGVTFGCAPNRYCPNAFVTRGQMAAFMNRLGALAPGKTPVVNATKLDGVDASGFMQFSANAGSSGLMRGTWISGGARSGAAQSFAISAITYQVPLATAPTPHIIQPAAAPPAGCSGSASAPNASPGHLCIFITIQTNNNSTSQCNLINNTCGGSASTRFGVGVQTFATADGVFYAAGNWAVRAPLGLAEAASDDTGIPGDRPVGTP